MKLKNEFLDYKTPPNLFKLMERDEDDCFCLKVIGKRAINHNTYSFVLGFPNKDWIAGMWPGAYCLFHAQIDGKWVTRKYSPISQVNNKGSFEFLIKIYRPNAEFLN